MRNRLLRLVCLVVLFSVFSCHKTTRINIIDQLKGAPDYKKTLKKWTKFTKHYYFNEVEFFINTTFKSWPMRLAYLKEYVRKFKIPEQEQLKLYEKELQEYQNYNDFFITVFSSKKDINDLSDSEKWRLYLHLGDVSAARLQPESIKEVDRDSILDYFYPQVSPWTSNYNVRFSRVMNDSQTGSMHDKFVTLSLIIIHNP